jgi:hypothetical protein
MEEDIRKRMDKIDRIIQKYKIKKQQLKLKLEGEKLWITKQQ